MTFSRKLHIFVLDILPDISVYYSSVSSVVTIAEILPFHLIHFIFMQEVDDFATKRKLCDAAARMGCLMSNEVNYKVKEYVTRIKSLN